jgi:hypothetical protein
MVVIEGNTYPHREALKRMGGRYNGATKRWVVPEAVADQARALVGASGPKKSGFRGGRKVCKTCGQNINYGAYCGKCEFSR